MKKTILLFICIFALSGFFALPSYGQGTGEVIYCKEFHVTKPIKDIPYIEKDYGGLESKDRENRIPQVFVYSAADGSIYGNDPAYIQTKMGIRQLNGKAIIQNWAGQTATGFRPFDPSGAAGPNHYIQMINSTTFKVYNKTGTTLLTQTLGNLWSPPTGNYGDPIVLYDAYANRWFLSQFGSGNQVYIAISTTADPLGSYYTYTFMSANFPDYLKFSVWENGYYMTSNQGGIMWCFERTQMLAGNAGSRGISATYTTGPTSGFFCPLPADPDGGLPPAGTPFPFFYYTENSWGGGAIDAVKIWNMTVTWGATATASCTLAATIATAAFDASYNGSWNDIVQPGTSQRLDGIGGVPTFRAQWRKWTGYNTVVLNWGVLISGGPQRSLYWVELRQNQSTGVWTLYQQGTYTPDAHSRWMGSIAMDANGSIALCYAKSSSTIFPSLCYTGRLASDPLGTMTFAEVVAIAGDHVQTSGNRFGDYSQTSLDPDGITFWHTGEYIAGTANNQVKTRIYSFQLPAGAPIAGVSIAVTAGSNPSCSGSSVTFTATPTNGGTTPAYQWKVNGGNVGTNSPTYSTTALTNGQIVTCVMTSNLPGVIGNPATSNAITMTINPILVPAVSIAITGGSNPSCAGASVTFTATPTNGGTTPAYQWKVNGGNVGTNSATYTTTALTNGQIVTCVLTSNATCASPTTATSNAITMTITPSVVPAISIALTAGSNPMCSGASATFTATPTNGGTTPAYQWKVNGGNVGTNSPTFTTTTLTNGQIVTCVLTSNATCATPPTATSNAITMTVNPILVPAVSIAITAGSNPSCAGASVTFTATPTNGGTTPAYQWKVNGGNVGTNSTTYTTTALANGNIVTCVITSNATCASPTTATSNAITMTVNAIPPTPTITQNGLILTSSAATGNQWYLNTVIIPGATGQSHTCTVNGSYTVVVTLNGCSSPPSAAVVIINVGIDEVNNKYGLSIFPNPNDGKFTIAFNSNVRSNFKIEIIDALGQQIYKETINEFEGVYSKQMNLIDFGKGIYTISLTNAKNETFKKIIVY